MIQVIGNIEQVVKSVESNAQLDADLSTQLENMSPLALHRLKQQAHQQLKDKEGARQLGFFRKIDAIETQRAAEEEASLDTYKVDSMISGFADTQDPIEKLEQEMAKQQAADFMSTYSEYLLEDAKEVEAQAQGNNPDKVLGIKLDKLTEEEKKLVNQMVDEWDLQGKGDAKKLATLLLGASDERSGKILSAIDINDVSMEDRFEVAVMVKHQEEIREDAKDLSGDLIDKIEISGGLDAISSELAELSKNGEALGEDKARELIESNEVFQQEIKAAAELRSKSGMYNDIVEHKTLLREQFGLTDDDKIAENKDEVNALLSRDDEAANFLKKAIKALSEKKTIRSDELAEGEILGENELLESDIDVSDVDFDFTVNTLNRDEERALEESSLKEAITKEIGAKNAVGMVVERVSTRSLIGSNENDIKEVSGRKLITSDLGSLSLKLKGDDSKVLHHEIPEQSKQSHSPKNSAQEVIADRARGENKNKDVILEQGRTSATDRTINDEISKENLILGR